MTLLRTSALSVLLSATPLLAQDEHTLRLKFAPDTTTHSLVTMDMKSDMNMGGREMTTTMVSQMWVTAKITAVKDDVAHLEHTITRITAKMDNPMMKVDYDSDDESSDPGPLGGLADCVGQKVTSKVSANGKVLEVSVPDSMDEATQRSGLNVRQIVEQGFVELPKDPIAVGGTWKTEQEMPMGEMGDSKVALTNKLASFAGDKATVEQDMKLDTSKLQMPPNTKMEVTKAKGTLVLDLARGLPVEQKTDMSMTIDGGEGGMKMAMTMQMSMKPAPAAAAKTEKVEASDKGEKKAKTDKDNG